MMSAANMVITYRNPFELPLEVCNVMATNLPIKEIVKAGWVCKTAHKVVWNLNVIREAAIKLGLESASLSEDIIEERIKSKSDPIKIALRAIQLVQIPRWPQDFNNMMKAYTCAAK